MPRHHAREVEIRVYDTAVLRRCDSGDDVADHLIAQKTVVTRIGIKIGSGMDCRQVFQIIGIRPDPVPRDFTTNSDLIVFKSLLIIFGDVRLYRSSHEDSTD